MSKVWFYTVYSPGGILELKADGYGIEEEWTEFWIGNETVAQIRTNTIDAILRLEEITNV